MPEMTMADEITLRDHIASLFVAHAAEHQALAEALTLARRHMEEAERARSAMLDARLFQLNELREVVTTDRERLVTNEKFDTKFDAMMRERAVSRETFDARMNVLENWKAKATGAGVVLALFAGAVGAAIVRAFN